MSIEQTLSSMAYRQLTQNMPSMTPNLLGFELITSNDDNTFALGVNVAVIGDTYVFIPTILKNGRIAPVDLMYVPELDQFLPCKDAWISYIQSKKTDLIASLNKNTHTSGAAGNVDLNMPFTNITKVASDVESLGTLLKTASSMMVEALCNAPTSTGIPCLSELIDIASSESGLKKLSSYMESTEGHNTLVEFYSDSELKDIADKLSTKIGQLPKVSLGSEGTVKILTSASTEARTLPTEDKVRILRDGAIIKDNRGLTPSTVYKAKVNSEWCTPNQDGLYELLKMDGSTMTAYVVPMSKKHYHSMRSKINSPKSFFVIPMDDGQARNAYTVTGKDIVGQPYANTEKVMPKGKSIANIGSETSSHVLMIAENGGPMELDFNDMRQPTIHKDDELIVQRRLQYGVSPYAHKTIPLIGSSTTAEQNGLSGLIIGRKGAKTRISGDYLRVGADATYFDIIETYKDSYLTAVRNLATIDNILEALKHRAGNISVNMFKAENGVYIDSDIVKVAHASDIDAEYALVSQLAVTPDEAHSMVKEASANYKQENKYIIKIAADTHVALSAPDLPVDDFQNSSITLKPMTNMSEEDRNVLNKAMESGTKEVFDVSLLRILAEEDSPAQIINEWMPALFTALDRVGRILYLCRAGESMQDAYGVDRVDDVERKLRKQFNELGDIILTMLKGKIKDFDDLRNGEL